MISSLAGRALEIEMLRDFVGGLLAGDGGALVIEGPEGAGRSALLHEGLAWARTAGAGVLEVSGVPAASASAFCALSELLGEGAGLERAEPGPTRAALVRRAGSAPLLIGVDDGQWLDESSAAVLVAVSSLSSPPPVALIVTVRSGDAVIAGGLTGLGRARRIRLAPLRPSALEELARELLPDSSDEARRLCVSETGGNPLLMREAAAILRGAPEPIDASEVVSPDARRRLIARLTTLGPSAEPIALAVAVLAADAQIGDLAALAERSMSETAEVLDALCAAEVLAPPDRFQYAFRAPIVARSLLAEAGAARLGLLHDRAARRLHARMSPAEVVAEHLLLAPPTGTPVHASILRRAGGLAVERGDPAGAAQLLQRALTEPPPAEERTAVLVELGRALAHVDVTASVDTLTIALAESEPGVARAGAAEQLGRALLVYAGRPADAVHAFTRALEELPPGDPRRVDIELYHLNAAREASVGRGTRPPLDGLVSGGEDEGLSGRAASAERALETVMQGTDITEALELARAALEGGSLVSIDGPNVPAAFAATSTLMWCGDYTLCLATLDALVDQAAARGSLAAEVNARYVRARARLAYGNVSGALSDSRRVLALEHDGFEQSKLLNRSVLAWALIERGESQAASDVTAAVAADAEASDGATLFWLMAVAHLAYLHGRPDDACAAYARAGELAAEAGCENPAVVPWRSRSAIVHAANGRLRLARDLVEDELARLHGFGGPSTAVARALRARAGLRPGPHELRDLEDAAVLLDAAGQSLERIHTLVALGSARRRAGDRSGAVRALRSGLDYAAAGGALAAERDARAQLSALGIRPRRTAMTGVAALTPSERRVADLTVAGVTNRDIARVLVVSPRTIEHHLTKIFRKLAITGRGELPAALAPDSDNDTPSHPTRRNQR